MSGIQVSPEGLYVVVEGQDGVGKTTQIKLLEKYFKDRDHKVIATREPGGELPSTEIIRNLLKGKVYDLDDITNVLLFVANRRELWLKVIEPALARGMVVISDRNWWSTLAYEHYGMGVSAEFIEKLHNDCMPERYISPDAGIVLHLDAAERAARQDRDKQRNITSDAFESRKAAFQNRVTAAYPKIAKRFNLRLVSAAASPDKIHQTIVKVLGDTTPL